MKINLTFLGATKTVTGSKYLLEVGSQQILIDCGLFQGLKNLRLKNWESLPFDSKKISSVLLTHAHLDHSGALPLLVKNGFSKKIYATSSTIDLCSILLPDSGYLQEEDARLANKGKYSKHHPALPLYTEDDARRVLNYFKSVEYFENTVIDDHILCQYLPGGHILGASEILVNVSGLKVLFSGDLGRSNDLIMKKPYEPEGCDVLIVESTYGNRTHDTQDPKLIVRDYINNTVQKGGTVLIPIFAVGRAQTVLYIIHELKKEKAIPDIPVFLNSPMAIDAQKIFEKHSSEHKLSADTCYKVGQEVRLIKTPAESMSLQELKEPKIILSASGMATGGRVLHHLKSLLPDEKNSVVFVGYQAAGTRGEALIHGADKIKIHGQYYPVKANIGYIDNLSAHADSNELLNWVQGMKYKPKKIFVTHGELNESESLCSLFSREFGIECVVPDFKDSYILGGN